MFSGVLIETHFVYSPNFTVTTIGQLLFVKLSICVMKALVNHELVSELHLKLLAMTEVFHNND